MIKKLFLYIALMMSFAACSDDIFDTPREEIPESGEIPVAFNIPDMTTTQTRGDVDETAIGKVTMLIYSSKDGSLVDAKDLTLTDNRTVITIPQEQRQNKDLYFLFFANDERNAESFSNNSDKQMAVAMGEENTYLTIQADANKERMTMSGAITLNQLLQLTPIGLYRNSAKVTVAPDNENSDAKFEYEVYGAASQSKLMAGSYNSGSNNSVSNYCGSPVSVKSFVNFGTAYDHNVDKATYLHPTQNKDGRNLNASYIMVRAKANDNNYYYYRLNFQNESGVLDILPNHHYEVKIITGKIGIGYPTQEEAAQNPIPLESGMYVIYDHSPKVFNIITDGVRALGVSDKLLNTGNSTSSSFYVKLFSSTDNAEEEYAEFERNFKEYIQFADNTWVKLDKIEKATEADELGNAGSNSVTVEDKEYKDGENVGVIYKITATFTAVSAGDQTTIGTINWKGLSRKFDVVWDRSFNAEDLYESVSVTFSGNTYGSNPSVPTGKYFEWIGGTLNDEGAYSVVPKVWGADETSNNGDPRDQGLHFPMNGGGTATYTITLKDLGGGSPYSWSYDLEGDDVGVTISGANAPSGKNVKKSLNAGEKPQFTISGGNDSYDYFVANLVIKVEKTARDIEEYRIPLYHTGFFMDANESKGENKYYKTTGIGLAKQLETGRDYTYYEIVTITRDRRNYRILDRNLGAHSAEMYVEATGDVEYAGNKDAAGGYYRVAGYKKLDKPAIDLNGIGVPEAFAIPQKEVFDDIRNSSNFSMAAVGNYYTSVYAGNYYGPADENGSRKRKYTYFPKSRYLDKNNSKVGDSRAGYYWTSTASSGLEKEDVGAWLDCLQLTGSTSSYMRGEVYCSSESTNGNSVRQGEINGSAMPVRLILAQDNQAGNTVYETNFFVQGATHVYLYTLDSKGTATPVTAWPGYAISTASTANHKYNFRYESKVNKTEDLYAIFNYKSESGAIFSMSYNAEDIKKGKFTNITNPKDLVGFNLAGKSQSGMQNGLAPDYANYGNGTKAVANGVTWTFSFNVSDSYATASKGGIGEGAVVEPETKNYRIYFPQDGTSKFYLWYVKNGNQHFFPNGADYSNKKFGNDYYYADFTSDKDENEKLFFSRGTNHDDKSLNKGLCDFELGDDGIYHAWIDKDDNFHAGKPSSSSTGWDGKSYRLYVKKWQPNLGGINTWFEYGGNGVTPPKGLLTADWWNQKAYNENDYAYIDLTIEGDFKLNWQPVYNASWDGNELSGNFGDTQSVTQDSFTYDKDLNKKVCKFTGWNESSGGKPARRKPASSKSSKRSR
ncbi:MAG: hypothetical protein K2M53_08015 [Muribaculaceae bacterium]|nr:hypothetical protein [Muribaculaceae bacterium]